MDQYLDAGNFTQKISGYICGAVSQYLRKVTLAINNRALPCSRSNNLFHGFNKQFIFFAEKHKWASTRVHKKTYFACAITFWVHIKSSRNSFNLSRIPVPLQLVQDIPSLVFDKILLWNSNPFEPKNVNLIFFLSFQNQIFSSTTWQVGEGGQGGAGGDCELCHADCSNNSVLSSLEILCTGNLYNGENLQ